MTSRILAKISDFGEILEIWRKILILAKILDFCENLCFRKNLVFFARILDFRENLDGFPIHFAIQLFEILIRRRAAR